MKKFILILAVLAAIPVAMAGTPDVQVERSNGQACPTESASYEIEVFNPGPASDVYNVEVQAPWTNTATLSSSQIPVDAGESERIYTFIRVPGSADSGTYSFKVDATSSNTGKTITSTADLTVFSCRSVSFEVEPSTHNVCRADTAEYDVEVTNEGSVEETYSLSTPFGELSRSAVTLESGESETVTLTVSSDEETEGTITVNAESTTSYAKDSDQVVFEASSCRNVDLTMEPDEAGICRGDTADVTATVANTGSRDDAYSVDFGEETFNVSVDAGDEEEFTRSIEVGENDVTIQASATSQSFSPVAGTASSTLTSQNCHDVGLRPRSLGPLSVTGDNTTLVDVEVSNPGTQSNSYSVELDGPDWMQVQPATVDLGPGGTENIYVYVSPDFTGEGAYTPKLVVAGDGVERELRMNVEVSDGTITVGFPGTQTPAGQIIRQVSGPLPLIVAAVLLLAGGYWFFRRREGELAPTSLSSTTTRDYHKSADDYLNQNTNTVVKGLREDSLSQELLEVLLEEEKQGKNRDRVVQQIEAEIEKKS